MDFGIRWSPLAVSNFEQIVNYISQDSKTYSMIFASNVLTLIESIPLFPKSGRMVPEYKDENLRERIYGNYRIIYRIKEDVIEIVAITHGSRMVDNLW